MVWVRGLALVVSLCVSSAAAAQDEPPPTDPPTTAQQKYTEATEKLSAGEYLIALATIDEGLALAPKNLPLLKLRGQVLLQKRDFEGALAAYEAFLAAKPRGANKRKARKIVSDLASVRTTFFKVNVTNGPARIYLDAKALGVYCIADPECKRGVLPGRYRLFIERDGFFPQVERIEVKLNQETSIQKTLIEKPSQATIIVTPADALVDLDGSALGVGTQTLELPAGDHAIVVTLSGFVTHTQRLAARAGKPVQVTIALSELVEVKLSVPEATLTLDGQPVTLQEGKLVIAPGGQAHALVAKAKGYRDATVSIAAQRERGTIVELTLEKIPPPKPPPVVVKKPPPRPPKIIRRGRGHRVAALGMSVIGFGAGSLGIVFGLQAQSEFNASKDDCDENNRCNARGLDAIEDAKAAAGRADITFAVCGAAFLGAVVLLIIAPSDGPEAPGRAVSIGPSVDGSGVGLTFSGGF